MFLKILQSVPTPTLLGLVISMLSVLLSLVLPLSVNAIFIIVAATLWLLLFFSEYKLSASNHLYIIVLTLVGHIPYLLGHYLL